MKKEDIELLAKLITEGLKKETSESFIKNGFTPRKRESKSGYKGVAYQKKGGNYAAKIVIHHKSKGMISIYLGNYHTPEDAYSARIKYLDDLK